MINESMCAISRLKKRSPTIVTVIFVFEVVATAVSGQSASPTPIESGDKKLLTSWSLATLVEPGDNKGKPPTYSYEKAAENHTTNVIVDVYWKLEKFYRRILPPGRASEMTSADGFLEYPTPTGPLYFGTGTDQFDTQAYTPKGGFVPSKTSSIGRGNGRQALNSTVQVAVPNETGFALCSLEITSAIISSTDRPSTTFQYSVYNRGSEQVRIFWDIPRDGLFESQLEMSKDYPLFVGPGESFTRNIVSNETAASALSTFIVFDKHQKVIAASVVGVFGLAQGRTTASPSDFWPRGHE
jgi:hypothetical protein